MSFFKSLVSKISKDIEHTILGSEEQQLKNISRIYINEYNKDKNLDNIIYKYDKYTKSFNNKSNVQSYREKLLNSTIPQTDIIYVLKLENDKFYIGRTNSLEKRLQQHKNNLGSEWTKKYKFVNLIETKPYMDIFDEDNMVKKYMIKYGINNVRGGTYSTIYLSNEQINFLKKEFTHNNDLCFTCLKSGHYSNNCPYKI